MFQRSFALYGNDRVIENVLHALDDINYPSEKAIGRAADLLDAVKLERDEAGYRRATAVLLPLAQRTTAGLLWRFAAEAAKTGAATTAAGEKLAVA